MRYVDELTSVVKAQLASAYRTKDLVGWAIRRTLHDGYHVATLRADAKASALLAAISLALALAFGVVLGLPPQLALYGTIVAGIVAPLLGGSRFVITAPTAGMVVVLLPVAQSYGPTGVLLTTAMCGAIVLLLGVLRFGRLLQFVPHPVLSGLSTGIAFVIACVALRDALGLATPRVATALAALQLVGANLDAIKWIDLAFAVATVTIGVLANRKLKLLPAGIFAIAVMTAIAALLHRYASIGPQTIANNFQYSFGSETLAGLPPLPPVPRLPWQGGASPSPELVKALLPTALAAALLASLSSLIAATIADGLSSTNHEPNAELVGLGAANVAAGLFGGMAASGIVARTTVNLQAGAQSPFAAALHGAIVLVVVVVFAPLLAAVPLAGLAGLLLMVAYNMADFRHVSRLLRIAPKSDVTVMVSCFLLTVFVDVALAIAVSMVLASMLFMRRIAMLGQISLATDFDQNQAVPNGVRLYELAGPLFFGAARTAFESLRSKDADVHTMVLSLRAVSAMDATSLVAFESALDRLRRSGKRVVLASMSPDIVQFLDQAGIKATPNSLMFAPDLITAMSIAQTPVN